MPLRPLGVGDILDGTFRLIRRNPKVMLGLSAAVAVAQIVLVALFELIVYSLLGSVPVTSTSGATGQSNLGPLLGNEAVSVAGFFTGLLLSAVLTGIVTTAVTQDVLGVRVDAREAWAQVRPRLGRLVGLAVIVSIVPALGLALCIAPGVWLWGIWTAAVPAFMVERTTIRGALGRSRHLVNGSFWRVWGIRALGVLMVTMVSSFITLPFVIIGLIADNDVLTGGGAAQAVPVLFLVLTALGSAIASTFTAPVRAGIDALLYLDLRMRREGLDIALQAAVTSPPAAGLPRTAF